MHSTLEVRQVIKNIASLKDKVKEIYNILLERKFMDESSEVQVRKLIEKLL